MKKDLDYYLKLPYTIELIPDSEQGWFVRIKELHGCMSQGDTIEEAYEMIQDAMRGWLEVAIEDNIPIPEPAPDEDYSGKFVVRLPRSLHRQLAQTAEREGVSLNQFINVALARAVEHVNPGIAYPMMERSSELAVKEKKPKYRAAVKKK
jgi:antitoxin HicB